MIATGGLIALWPIPSLARRRSLAATRRVAARHATDRGARADGGARAGLAARARTLVEFLLVLLVLVAVVYIVSGPLRRPEAGDRSSASARRGLVGVRRSASGPGGGAEAAASSPAPDFAHQNELSELEAAREAKYREIRDTQLDYDTGKLSSRGLRGAGRRPAPPSA